MDSIEIHTKEPATKSLGSEFSEADAQNLTERNIGDGCDSDTATVNNENIRNLEDEQTGLEKNLGEQKDEGNSILRNTNCSTDPTEVHVSYSGALQNEQSVQDSLLNGGDSLNLNAKDIDHSISNEKFSEVIVKTSKPLCADYHSDSDCESVDSESDSSTTSTDSSTEASSDSEEESDDSHGSSSVKGKTVKGERKLKRDLSLSDLPPIENLKINVPEDACVEIGKITSIVETLVIVESYKGTSALDIDTVLFLDSGRETLGKVFDILGPVSEPVYAVRFNSQEQIKNLNLEKDMKVYYAPKTEHTTFVFMSEVLKNKGSDASWKDNVEAPPEFQDFSDDEEERLHKNKQGRESDRDNHNVKEQNKSRKRSFNKMKQTSRAPQGSRFRNPDFSQQRPYFQRNPPMNQFMAQPPFPRPNFANPVQIPPFPYSVPPYPAANSHSRLPHLVFPQRLSGPPFPTFSGLAFLNQSQNFQQPFYQQRTHAFPQAFGAWGKPMFRPPPPPPPPADQPLASVFFRAKDNLHPKHGHKHLGWQGYSSDNTTAFSISALLRPSASQKSKQKAIMHARIQKPDKQQLMESDKRGGGGKPWTNPICPFFSAGDNNTLNEFNNKGNENSKQDLPLDQTLRRYTFH